MTRGVARLLRPESIAVIGGGVWSAAVVTQCRRMGFAGPVWPVHPTREDVGGVRAFRDIADLPGVPDAVFIGVNRHLTVDLVGRLRALGAGGAVCFASGFSEAQAEAADGAGLQAALVAAAGNMPVLGPNCYGFVNYLDGAALWPDQQGGAAVTRGVAVLTQSSNMAINLTMQARGLPLAYMVTAGNQAQTGLAELGRALLEDARVTALGLHIEGVGDLRSFEALAARARELRKPVVVLKVGRSDQARAAAVSHTASLAGSDAGAAALFARLGMAQVDDLASLVETLKLLHLAGPLASRRIVSMSCSGGEAGLMADLGGVAGLVFPPLDTRQHDGLRAALGPMVALANPLDYHTYVWNDVPRMAAVFGAMMAADIGAGVIVVDFPRADRCVGSAWDCVIEAASRAAAGCEAPLCLLATLPETMPEAVAQRAMAAGLVPLCGLREGLEALRAASDAGQMAHLPAPVLLAAPAGTGAVRDEARAKPALAEFGLDVPSGHVAETPGAAAEAAATIGFPVVLKGRGAAHKTEAGLVALNLGSEAEVAAAAARMDAPGYLVEEMLPRAVAELLVGVVHDPAHGFVLTLGAGGILTEIVADSRSLLLPARDADITAALRDLRIAPLIAGYRGAPPACIPAIVAAIRAVQDYVTANAARVAEVEINPLLCLPDRAVAVDALIREGTTT